MPKTQERIVWGLAKTYVSTPSEDPFDVGPTTFTAGNYMSQYEKYTPNSTHGARHRVRVWKSFQHYKCVLMDSATTTNRPIRINENGAYSSYDPEVYRIQYAYVQCPDPNGCCVLSEYGGRDTPFFGLVPLADRATVDEDFITPPDELQELVLRSLQSMVPGIKKNLSLVNSIIELKDLVTMKASIVGLRRVAQSFLRDGLSSATLRRILHSSADGWLQAQFNFLPMISDIKSVIKSLADYKARGDALAASDGQPLVHHFVYKWDEFPVWADPIHVPSGIESPCGDQWWPENLGCPHVTGRRYTTRYVEHSSTEFRAQLQFVPSYSNWQREHARVLTLLDSLGVNPNPAIVWNAIPWSFVVDWIVNVQSFLDDIGTRWTGPVVNILQYLWSVRRRRRIWFENRVYTPFIKSADPAVWYWTVGSFNSPEVVETAYRREATMPASSLFVTSGLSLKEFSLATALAITRNRPGGFRNRNRKRWRRHAQRAHKHAK